MAKVFRISLVSLANFVAATITANIPIRADKDAVAYANREGSIYDSPVTAKLRRPMLITIGNIVFDMSFALWVIATITANPANIVPIAAMPRATAWSSRFDNKSIESERTPIAAAIASNIVPALAALAPAKCETATMAANSAPIPTTKAVPRLSSFSSIDPAA